MRTLLLVLCACCFSVLADAAPYGVARSPAPVLNTAAFSSVFGGIDGKTLKTDRCGQVRELEFIALPGTVFSIRGESRDGAATVFRVETADYPVPAGVKLYVDSRFIELREDKPVLRARKLPPATEIVSTLKSFIGSPYVWGGNLQGGVPELMKMFYRNGAAGCSMEPTDPGGPGLFRTALPGQRWMDTPQYLAACFLWSAGAGHREDCRSSCRAAGAAGSDRLVRARDNSAGPGNSHRKPA